MILKYRQNFETFKQSIIRALRAKERMLFPEDITLFLYDLTNTYFEGSCQKNELAKRGKSKEKRSDCPLVTLAMVVDSRGFPILSQIYHGNQSEPETLAAILEKLLQDSAGIFTSFLPTIVMDRGIAGPFQVATLIKLSSSLST